MFKIKNTYGGKVIIGDLNIRLTNGQEIDLDCLYPREKSEASLHLRVAIEKNILTVTEKTPANSVDAAVIADLEARLRAEIQSSQQVVAPTPEPVMVQPDLSHLNNKIDAIIAALSKVSLNEGNAKPQANAANAANADDVVSGDLEADTQVDIHSRVIERLRRNAEGHVESKQETKKSDVSDRADELEGLI